MAKLIFEPRVTKAGNVVPPCSFYPVLRVLVTEIGAALKDPNNAVRTIAMLAQYIAQLLQSRDKEELERSSPLKEKEKWVWLRFHYTRRDLKVLKQAVWSQVENPPPIGPAMREALSVVEQVLAELNSAYAQAIQPPDDGRKSPTVEALPDLDLPDEPSDGMPERVDYDEMFR
jgi:hypothetical protein